MSVKTRTIRSGYKLQKVPTAKYGYKLLVYKKDRRFKDGEKLVDTIEFEGYSGNAIMDEIKYLHSCVYPRNKFRLDFVNL